MCIFLKFNNKAENYELINGHGHFISKFPS